MAGQTAAPLLLLRTRSRGSRLAQVAGRGILQGPEPTMEMCLLFASGAVKTGRRAQNVITQEALDASHVQALAVSALRLQPSMQKWAQTRLVTVGHGVDLHQHSGGLLVLSRPNHLHVSGKCRVGRTFSRAGSLTHLGGAEDGVVAVRPSSQSKGGRSFWRS